MKETNDKVYYLEYISIIFLVFSFILLISVVLNNKKNNKSNISASPLVKEKKFSTYNREKQEINFDKSDKYMEHICILKRIGFKIIGLNLNSAVASVYVDKNIDAYNKMKNFYSKCVIIDLNAKYQIFIDNLFEQKTSMQTHSIINNMQGKYEVQYVIVNDDNTWTAKINDKIYTKNSVFDSGFRIVEVTNLAILVESDNGQIYKIVL